MKPRLLKISGLNSFIEEQVIDFESLIEYGLFGIFGPTGSGKSTILDAMTLALYGEISRCDKRDLNGIINTNIKQVQVYYEFDIGRGNNRKSYSVKRILKRTGENGSSVSTDTALLCDITNPEEEKVLSEKVTTTNQLIQDIIGLNAQDFMRSVVIPQGSFSEFLQLKGNERRQMLERIFRLEEYGESLTEKIRTYQQKAVGQLKELQGQLSTYENISEEVLKELKTNCDELLDLKQSIQQAWEKAENDYEKYKNVWEFQKDLKDTDRELELLGDQHEIFEEKEKVLDRARKATALKPRIERLEQMEQNLIDRRKTKAEVDDELIKIENQIRELEVLWREAGEDKDKQLPILAVKKENFTRAVDILKEAVLLEHEADKLREECNKSEEEIKELKGNIQEKVQQSTIIRQEIEENREAQRKHMITSEEKQAIEEAYSLERDYKALVRKCIGLDDKKSTLCKQIGIQKEQLSGLVKAKTEISRLLQDNIRRKKQHENSCPGSQNILLEKQKELSYKQDQICKVLETEEEIAQIHEKLRRCIQLEDSLKKAVEDLKKQYDDKDEYYIKLSDDLKEVQNRNMTSILANTLEEGKACPVCGSIHHPMPFQEYTKAAEMENLEDRADKLRQVLNGIRSEIIRKESDQKQVLNQMKELEKELIRYNKDIEGQNSSVLKQQYQASCEEFEQLKKSIEQWEIDAKSIEKAIEANKNDLLELNSQESANKASLEILQNTFKEVENEAKQEMRKLEQLETKYSAAKDKWGIDDFEDRICIIRKHERELEALRRVEEQLNLNLDQINADIENMRNTERQLEFNKIALEGNREQTDKDAKYKRQQAEHLAEGGDPGVKFIEVSKEMEDIQNRWSELNKSYEESKLRGEELKNRLTAATEGCKALEEQVSKESQVMMELLAEQGFAGPDIVLECFVEKRGMDKLDKEIQNYRERISILKDRRNGIIKKLQGQSIQKEEWEKLQKQKLQLGKELEDCKGQLLKVQVHYEDMNKGLKEKQKLLETKKELEHKNGLIDEIAGLIRGRRFVDFVARRQLRYIVREASRRMKDITRQRYALELDEEGSFVIRDDFNGGARRPAHTLSGGETFVTSLSLALALSSHIQLGKAVLEFFFLDEGFGTLDAELLDTVINSLEQLQDERLSVGLISHVEELKQRIPKKLIVHTAVSGQHGTRVIME